MRILGITSLRHSIRREERCFFFSGGEWKEEETLGSVGKHSGEADKASQRANIIFHRVDAQERLLSRPRRRDPPRFA